MKIAFVGKGGSGKTTISSLFIQNLIEKGKKVIAIDADINVGLGDALGIIFEKEKYISENNIKTEIKKYLIGENSLIKSPKHFVKTTPPSKGSNLISGKSEKFFEKFCSYQDESLKFFHVGTYEKEEIGISCYHTNLSILENILSHTNLGENEFLIVDMVAGNDAFSGALYSQFDIVFLIAEPTHESTSMINLYLSLAKASEISSPIGIIYNKIEDEDDINYLKKNGIESDLILPYNKEFKKIRREGGYKISSEIKDYMNQIEKYATQNADTDQNKKLLNLYSLHKKLIELDYIKMPLGDLSNQIDLSFKF